MPMPIETPRFRIRWLAQDDAPVVHQALFADDEVLKYLPPRMAAESPDRTERRVGRWIEARERDGYGWAVIDDRETGDFLGMIGLLALEEEPGAAELATLLARAAWGKRLATETSGAMVDFGLDEAGIERIVAFIHPDNTASRRAAATIGFGEDGTTEYLDEEVLRYVIDAESERPSRSSGG